MDKWMDGWKRERQEIENVRKKELVTGNAIQEKEDHKHQHAHVVL